VSLLIAEIGNCHLGSMKLARELIKQAHESGADVIKGQAFLAKDITTGSMPKRFYEACALSEDQYIELIEYARYLGSDMFYSVFSDGFDRLKQVQSWTKFAASQTSAGAFTKEKDSFSAVVSYSAELIRTMSGNPVPLPKLGWALYATPYLPIDPELQYLEFLEAEVGNQVGLSDHTKSFFTCLRAIRYFNVNCIEKHFTLQKDVCWDGVIFRDTVHGATPRELEIIANALH
jgi:sialic acid synthase SpsE